MGEVMENFKKYALMLCLGMGSLAQADIRILNGGATQGVLANDYESLRQQIADTYNRDLNDLERILLFRWADGVPVTVFLNDEAPQAIYDFLNNGVNGAFVMAFFNPL
jgi:hypothetical protein